jgi:hypothetical protein
LPLGVDMGDALVVPVYAETVGVDMGIGLEPVQLVDKEDEKCPEEKCQLSHDMREYIIYGLI